MESCNYMHFRGIAKEKIDLVSVIKLSNSCLHAGLGW